MGKKVDLKPQSASKPTAVPKAKKVPEPQDSSESEPEEVQPVPRKLSAEKLNKEKKSKGKKDAKKPEPVLSSDSEAEEVKQPPAAKKVPQPAAKQPAAVDSGSSSEEEPVAPPTKKDKKKDRKKDKKRAKAEAKAEETKVPAKRGADEAEAPKKKHKKEPKEAKEEVKKEAVDPEEQVEIYVGGLAYTATEEDVKQFFSSCGEIENIKFLRKHDGAFRGAGFIKFATHEQAIKALEFNETEHMGRTLKVNFAANKPNGGRPEGGINTVCVRNLSYESTDDGVASFFGQCGTVVSVRVARAQDGRGKGFAHVEFEAVESADKAVALSGQKLDERPLRVDYAHPKRITEETTAAEPKPEKVKEKSKKSEAQGEKKKL